MINSVPQFFQKISLNTDEGIITASSGAQMIDVNEKATINGFELPVMPNVNETKTVGGFIAGSPDLSFFSPLCPFSQFRYLPFLTLSFRLSL